MSEAKRAYNILRSYVNREWDRIKNVDLDAWRELDEPTKAKPGSTPEQTVDSTLSDPTNPANRTANDFEATARTILGVTAKADFEEIRKAYEKIHKRSQPDNFKEGSAEQEHAAELLRKATWAYNFLTKNVSQSEKRFRSLEIE
ncbi:MAG: DnaJ domain-containing protein [Fimbriimonadaceae bacterium]